jgi:transcriptional adapter 3
MPSANKGKGKGRDVRPSRSRNTTPSSGFGAAPAPTSAPVTSYLENDASKLVIPVTIQYSEILERMGGVGPIPDSKSLELLMEHLKSLSQSAEARGDACNAGIRELSQKRKEVVDEPEPYEGDDRVKMKREDDDEEESKWGKAGKLKKRKDRGSSSKEERPLAHGAREITRQDGGDAKVEGGKSL